MIDEFTFRQNVVRRITHRSSGAKYREQIGRDHPADFIFNRCRQRALRLDFILEKAVGTTDFKDDTRGLFSISRCNCNAQSVLNWERLCFSFVLWAFCRGAAPKSRLAPRLLNAPS